MRLNHSFSDGNHRISDDPRGDRRVRFHGRKVEDEHQVDDTQNRLKTIEKASAEEDQRLKKAATIGTSLMVINSHRALYLLTVIVTVLPMIQTITGVNPVADEMTALLQQNNINAVNCEHLEISVHSWLESVALVLSPAPLDVNKQFLLWAQISPSPRGCDFLNGTNGVITMCSDSGSASMTGICRVWEDLAPPNPNDATSQYFADRIGVREGGIIEYTREYYGLPTGNFNKQGANFTVRVLFNQNAMVGYT